MAIETARTISPGGVFSGAVRVPGDKSISHRAAMLAGLAWGRSLIRGFLCSEDCLNTLRAVGALGAGVQRRGTEVEIEGVGGRFISPSSALDMGNSGTGIRLLAGILAGHDFVSELTGDASLRSRPMRRIKEPLEMMGATVECLGQGGCAPIRIRGGSLRAITYPLPVASAQVKSCVLLAGLFADGVTRVIEPLPTRDHTERIFTEIGIPLNVEGLTVSVQGFAPSRVFFPAFEMNIPGDFSSAAYWIAAAAAVPGSEVLVEGVGLNPRRTALLDVLRRMGSQIEVRLQEGVEGREPRGDVIVRGCRLKATTVSGAEIPNLIDEIPVLSAVAALADGTTVIKDASELRVKESDRIAAMAAGLSALNIKTDTFQDGIAVTGGGVICEGAAIDSRDDHRIAMSFAVLAAAAGVGIRIEKTACVATSYPEFWRDLEGITGVHVGTSYSD